MIASIRLKGLERFFGRADVRGIDPRHASKLRRVLSVLQQAQGLEDLRPFAFLRLHPLKGGRSGRWAVDVSGNRRITFSVNAEGELDELDLRGLPLGAETMEPMHDPAHPGEILREELEARGTTITAAARALGVTRKALSDIVNLKAGVSPLMARRLEAALGTPARLWINLQATFNLSRAEKIDLGHVEPIRAAAEG